MCLSTILLSSYRVEHTSLQTYQRRLSVRPSALMHAKLSFPDKRSRFNERRTRFCRRHPVITKIKYMCITTRACTLIVNVPVIIEPRERTHARVCDMENFYAMHMYLLLITGSEYDEIIWAGAYNKWDQRRLRRACAYVQSCQGHVAH